MALDIGNKLPRLKVAVTGEPNQINLADLKGQNVVLYFYPRDNTPGCTDESNDFKTHHRKFKNANTIVYGISRDSLKSHDKFKAKFDFPFELISDEDEKLCGKFDVVKEKNMYGKKVFGIERSTFVFDDQGVMQHAWRKVKVPGHVDEVLNVIKKINKS